ncbi:hypothetical protein VI08_16255 [Luteibacter yeojuensis]|uniref:Lipoprotein n=2 Tax=Luteibacter yeojuensis TaxID=345309 RepID=A0A0F3KDC5_9GAMM|nr:hypothetical protein VI08_16255 [Luteibacter yeojuensis]
MALTTLLAACDSSQPPAQAAAPAAAATAPQAAAPAVAAGPSSTCPAPTFDGFLKQFTDDPAVQKRYIADPLESDTVDANAEPEPAPVKKMLSKAEVTFPVIPDSARQGKDGLVMKKTAEGDTGYAVELAKPDTDYQMTFHFRSADGCWQLVRTEDDSL